MEVLVTQLCQLFVTPWTVAHQAPLYVGFSRQEYWSGLPSPGDLTNPEMEPRSPALQADSLPSEPPGNAFTYLNKNMNQLAMFITISFSLYSFYQRLLVGHMS